MKRVPIESQSIAALAYDRRRRILEVGFCNSGIYQYFHVPPTVYVALLRASSKGRFLNAYIRNRYPYARI